MALKLFELVEQFILDIFFVKTNPNSLIHEHFSISVEE